MSTRARKGVTPPMDLRAIMGAVMSGEEVKPGEPVEAPAEDKVLKEEGGAPESAPTSAPETVAQSTTPSPEARQPGKGRKPVGFEEQGNPQIIKQFQLRLPEPLKYKLDWVTKNLVHTSAHALILEALEDRLNTELSKASTNKH